MINNQNKNKVFLVIIAILLLANIGMLVFFLQAKEPEKQSNRADRKAFITNFLQKEIGFDQQQLMSYDSLSNRHHEKMSGLFENIRNRKTGEFKQLATGNFEDSVINTVADQSAASQKMMEVDMFTYIKSIRTLCTPGQLPKFDSLFIKVFNRKGEGRKKSSK